MSINKDREIGYIDGSTKTLLDDYKKEKDVIKSQLPQATEHEVRRDNATPVVNIVEDRRRSNMTDKLSRMELESSTTLPAPQKEKRKYTTVSDEMRSVITNIYNNSNGNMNIQEVAKNLGIKEDTLRRLRRRLANGESIERSKVKRGRHTKVTREVAANLNQMFLDKTARSDAEASRKLKEKGINVSREAIQRAMTNGLMENYGFESLTMKRICYRKEDTESPENKQAGKIAMSKLNEYMKNGYHLIFVDETHWSVGWAWNKQRGKRGKKSIIENSPRIYSITAVFSITELGPGDILVSESASVNAELLSSFMVRLLNRNPGEKEVFFLDNASVHNKEDLLQLVHNVKNKEIVFNAPYSPEDDSVEAFFANWKHKVEEQCHIIPSSSELVKIIKDTFLSFRPDDCLNLINHVHNDVVVDP